VRKRTGASLVGVIRNGTLQPNPGPEFRFAEGDAVAVMGRPEQYEAFQELALPKGTVPE